MATAVLYDEVCGFCKVVVHAIRSWDVHDKLRAVPIQSEEGQRLLAPVPEDERLTSFHTVTEDGVVTSAGPALAGLFALLPAGGVVAAPLRLAPGVAKRGYELIATNRTTISKAVPGALKRRAGARLPR